MLRKLLGAAAMAASAFAFVPAHAAHVHHAVRVGIGCSGDNFAKAEGGVERRQGNAEEAIRGDRFDRKTTPVGGLWPPLFGRGTTCREDSSRSSFRMTPQKFPANPW